ncbi:hypothetical protein LTS12_021142 [Elasticomyces elasticus]|nr:hypothetical protein LTS12_021142 [Elasticomyces elasticus]
MTTLHAPRVPSTSSNNTDEITGQTCAPLQTQLSADEHYWIGNAPIANMRQHPQGSLQCSSDALEDLFGPMDHNSAASSSKRTTDSSFPSNFPTYAEMAGSDEFLSTDATLFDSNDGFDFAAGAPIAPDDMTFDFSGLSGSMVSPVSSISSSRASTDSGRKSLSTTPCFCLATTLGLMKQLHGISEDAYHADKERHNEASSQMAKGVVAQTKIILDSVSCILDCRSFHDGYVLAMVALVVFRVLGLYETIAYEPLQQLRQISVAPMKQDFKSADGHRLGRSKCTRRTIQSVLSELRRIRCLVDQLAAFTTELHTARQLVAPTCRDDASLPLSSQINDQIIADMRTLLRALSVDMISRLKEY